MKIKLVSPRVESGFNHINFYRYGGKTFFASPGSLATVAALTPKGVSIEIIDEHTQKLDLEEPVDLVGISIMNSYMAPRAYKIASIYRQKGVPVVFGGLHTLLFPKECLKYADSVVIGEAEDVWEKVIADFKRHKLKRVYKHKNRPSLKNRPVPRWDLVRLNAYDVITVNATRGCPYNCEFCLMRLHMGNKLRHKPIEAVVKEVAYIRDNFKPKNIWFVDPNFTIDKVYAKKLIRALIPLKIRYYCFTNIDIYKDKELLELLAMSGCYALSVGIESLDYRNIADTSKECTNNVKEYEKAIKEIRRYGIDLIANFIVGNTYDNEKTFESLQRFITKNNIAHPCIFPASVFPRTKWQKRFGKDYNTNSEFRTCDYVGLKPTAMDSSKFWIYYTQMFYEIYSYKATFKRLFRFILQQREYSKTVECNRYKDYFTFKNLLRILKKAPTALRAGIRSKSFWGFMLELFSNGTTSFVAWQRIACSKNFLIAYCNLKVNEYSKEPEPSLNEDLLLKTIRQLVKNSQTISHDEQNDQKKIP